MVQSDFQSAFFTYYVVSSFQCQRVNEYTDACAAVLLSVKAACELPWTSPTNLKACLLIAPNRYRLNFILKRYVHAHACVYVALLKAMVNPTDVSSTMCFICKRSRGRHYCPPHFTEEETRPRSHTQRVSESRDALAQAWLPDRHASYSASISLLPHAGSLVT